MAEKQRTDHAGALLGWSIGTGIEKRPLDELIDFPCTYDFKAVGASGINFIESLLGRVEDEIGRDIKPYEYRVRKSSAGKYSSITLSLHVSSADEIYRIYAAIKHDDRVKYLL